MMKTTIKNKKLQNKLLLIVSVAVAAIFMIVSAPAHAVKFTQKEKELLKAGKVIKKELPSSGKKGFYGGSGYAVINAPADVVWRTLVDWGSYKKIFPNTELCEVVSAKGKKTLIKMKIGHPVANVQYHAEMTENKDKWTLSFLMVENHPHDLDSIKGYWRLFPQKNGRTLAAYVVAVKAPMGIVQLAGDDLAKRAIRALLHIPGNVKRWVEGPNGVMYKKED